MRHFHYSNFLFFFISLCLFRSWGLVSLVRTFGSYRNNSNVIPDDIEGLPNTHLHRHLAEVPSEVLYDAEIDQGYAFRCLRPIWAIYVCPFMWIHVAASGISSELKDCTCDEVCCWVRKEYSSRNYIRVYSNRIEVNTAKVRWFGMMGCGSWNTDSVTVHLFDRGAFGFRRVPISYKHMCCFFPVYGKYSPFCSSCPSCFISHVFHLFIVMLDYQYYNRSSCWSAALSVQRITLASYSFRLWRLVVR